MHFRGYGTSLEPRNSKRTLASESHWRDRGNSNGRRGCGSSSNSQTLWSMSISQWMLALWSITLASTTGSMIVICFVICSNAIFGHHEHHCKLSAIPICTKWTHPCRQRVWLGIWDVSCCYILFMSLHITTYLRVPAWFQIEM